MAMLHPVPTASDPSHDWGHSAFAAPRRAMAEPLDCALPWEDNRALPNPIFAELTSLHSQLAEMERSLWSDITTGRIPPHGNSYQRRLEMVHRLTLMVETIRHDMGLDPSGETIDLPRDEMIL